MLTRPHTLMMAVLGGAVNPAILDFAGHSELPPTLPRTHPLEQPSRCIQANLRQFLPLNAPDGSHAKELMSQVFGIANVYTRNTFRAPFTSA